MSAIKDAQAKILGQITAGEPALVAEFDFSILIGIAVQLLTEYLSSCLAKDEAAAAARTQDGFWYRYFARKAARDAVRQKYAKSKRRGDAEDLLAESLSVLTTDERAAVLAETKEVHELAGLLI